MMHKSILVSMLVLALMIGITGCSDNFSATPTPEADEPTGGDVEAQPDVVEGASESENEPETVEPTPEIEIPESVIVEDVAVNMLESLPIQFVAIVTGTTNAPCLEVVDTYQVADNFTLYLELLAASSGESDCPAPPTPFELNAYLDPTLLEPGTWTLIAGEVSTTFEITEADLSEAPPEDSEAEDDAEAGDFMIFNLAMVDSATPLVQQGPPVQVELLIRGNLNDGCTELYGDILQQGQGTTDITVYLQTQRPQDAMCTMMLVPFETTIELEGDFPPGAYTVTVNDEVEATFTVE